jgi:hypothetical protein
MDAGAQCLTLPYDIQDQIVAAERIVEGKVVDQRSWIGSDGNIYTSNTIGVHRVFKGQIEAEIEVITEGGMVGDLMQTVTPSAKLGLGDHGLIEIAGDAFRGMRSMALGFYPIDEKNGTVYGMKNILHRDELYELVHRTVGQSSIQLIETNSIEGQSEFQRSPPQIASIHPLSITAGTRSLLTISGQGFGAEQGSGSVAFRNADDGGQSFVSVPSGPHYLSWSDTEVIMYVPSTSLYSSTVAGTGEIRVINDAGNIGQSTQQLSVTFAQSEVVYSEVLNETQLVGMNEGGYLFHENPALLSLLEGQPLVDEALRNWSCNTRVNFRLSEEPSEQASFANDGINLLGLSAPGQLPSNVLGRTVTTFSGCGTGSGGIQWNLIEVDILMNGDINWWTSDLPPMANSFDLTTALLHELGHAHLLQHNSNTDSPMYFQLTAGSMRRDLNPDCDIAGGTHVTELSVASPYGCSYSEHSFQDDYCDLSQINGIEEASSNAILVYPNPFQDQLTLSGKWSIGSQFRIFDATGRVVLNGMLNSSEQSISTYLISNGIYTLEVQDDTRSSVVRLIKN